MCVVLTSVKLKGISVYHPQLKVSNEDLVKGQSEEANDLIGLWNYFGRSNRYLSESENTLTMAIEASKQVLKETGLEGKDIDMIVFSSGTHEFSVPTDASFVHQAIDGKEECIIYDSNANCVGMIVAYDQIYRTMVNNPNVRRALLVGSEQLSRYYMEKDLASLGLCGDAACAVILEKVEDDVERLVESAYFTSSLKAEDLRLPGNGLSNAMGQSENNRMYLADGYNVNIAFPTASVNIKKMLQRHGLDVSEVKSFLFSQFNPNVFADTANELGADLSRFKVIVDEYGYTGTSSPFIALYHELKEGKLQEGDLFVMWSVGAGITSCGLLVRL